MSYLQEVVTLDQLRQGFQITFYNATFKFPPNFDLQIIDVRLTSSLSLLLSYDNLNYFSFFSFLFHHFISFQKRAKNHFLIFHARHIYRIPIMQSQTFIVLYSI